MKTKYLFGMLLSGALLAACTAEDDLNSAKLTQKANPSAPVFSVRLDDNELQNRVAWNEGNAALGFEAGDLLSLFHGVEDVTSGFTGYENAVYEGASVGDEGFQFTTKSQVNEGAAVLVWPVDTAFVNYPYTSAPILTMNLVQDVNTKKSTPYISEILDIEEYSGDETAHEAGYGRDYDIVLKRIGGTLALNLNIVKTDQIPANVAAMKVTKVQMESTSAVFTDTIPVAVGANRPAAYVAYQSASKPGQHTNWLAASDIDETQATKQTKVSTTDVENASATSAKAVFTLLPNATTAAAGASVTIYTTYGKKILNDQTAKVNSKDIWNGTSNDNGTKSDVIITTGLNNAFKYLWHTAQSSSIFNKSKTSGSNGETEYVGTRTTCTLASDLSGLDMDSLHIIDENHLKDAIIVYNAISSSKDVTFILDGKNGKFTMTKDAWTAVENQLKKNGNKLNFTPCVQENNCTAIVLDSKGEASEVPALKFVSNKAKPTFVPNLELKGTGWTYTSKTSGDDAKDISGIAEIHLVKDATLTPKDFVAVKGGASNATTIKLVIDQGATVNVNSSVDVQIDVENKGTIEIASTGTLRMGVSKNNAAKTLTNWAENSKADGSITGLNRKCGVINNSGYLGVVGPNATNQGEIHNIGLIDIKTDDAETAITTNAVKDNCNFADEYKTGDNQFGTVKLANMTGSGKTKIYKTNRMGFVTCTIDKATPVYNDFGGDNCMANYIILGSSCKTIKYTATTNSTTGVTTYGNLPATVKYIEVGGNVDFDGKNFELDGLIVKNSAHRVTILKTAEVKVGCFYLKGKVSIFGKLNDGMNDADVQGYFGGAATDVNNFSDSGTN